MDQHGFQSYHHGSGPPMKHRDHGSIFLRGIRIIKMRELKRSWCRAFGTVVEAQRALDADYPNGVCLAGWSGMWRERGLDSHSWMPLPCRAVRLVLHHPHLWNSSSLSGRSFYFIPFRFSLYLCQLGFIASIFIFYEMRTLAGRGKVTCPRSHFVQLQGQVWVAPIWWDPCL